MLIDIKENDSGFLLPIDISQIPFELKRCFVVKSKKEECQRGNHAHINEEHFLICLGGEIEILSEDSEGKKTFTLKAGDCFYQKEMVWLSLNFKLKESVLLVFANSEYTEKNYIREYENFKNKLNVSKLYDTI